MAIADGIERAIGMQYCGVDACRFVTRPVPGLKRDLLGGLGALGGFCR